MEGHFLVFVVISRLTQIRFGTEFNVVVSMQEQIFIMQLSSLKDIRLRIWI